MAIEYEWIFNAFPVIWLVSAAAMFIRFRGTMAGLVGGFGFLLWVLSRIVRQVVELDMPYAFAIVNIVGYVMILFALGWSPVERTTSVAANSQEAIGSQRPKIVTVIGWLLIVLAAIGLVALVVSGIFVEFNAAFAPIIGAFSLAAFLQIVMGTGILYGENWARWSYLILALISLALSLVSGNIALVTFVQFALFLGALYCLTRPAAVDYFRRSNLKPCYDLL